VGGTAAVFGVAIGLGLGLTACTGASVPTFQTTAETVAPSSTLTPLSPDAIEAPTRRGPLSGNATVVHLVDGDTLDVTWVASGKGERIRLIGIDTPESKRPNTPTECFAKKSAAALAALVPKSTTIRIEPDVEQRDRYGRYLGYVFRAQDGLFVNLEMARVGMAVPLTFPPNVAYADQFVSAGNAAQAAGIGLWSQCEGPHVPADPEPTTTIMQPTPTITRPTPSITHSAVSVKKAHHAADVRPADVFGLSSNE
jgi:micrococcal nuclease